MPPCSSSPPGTNTFPAIGPITFKAGCSRREPNLTPAQDTSVTYATWDEFEYECSQTRAYAGVHFQASSSHPCADSESDSAGPPVLTCRLPTLSHLLPCSPLSMKPGRSVLQLAGSATSAPTSCSMVPPALRAPSPVGHDWVPSPTQHGSTHSQQLPTLVMIVDSHACTCDLTAACWDTCVL